MLGTLLVTGFHFLNDVACDDRKENWYVGAPLVTELLFTISISFILKIYIFASTINGF